MNDFKFGDRVEFISKSGEGDPRSIKGEHGEVRHVSNDMITVAMDSGTLITVFEHRLRKLSFEVTPIVTGMPGRLIQFSIPIPGEFKVGDRVMLATADPEYGRGEVDMFEVGTITDVGTGERGSADVGDIIVEFPSDEDWVGVPGDLKHAPQKVREEFPLPEVALPDITLDEAVKGCQDIRQQMAELAGKARVFEEVMRKAGVKFI
jgi:hypothetical protein